MKNKAGELTKHIAEIVATRWVRRMKDVGIKGVNNGNAKKTTSRRRR